MAAFGRTQYRHRATGNVVGPALDPVRRDHDRHYRSLFARREPQRRPRHRYLTVTQAHEATDVHHNCTHPALPVGQQIDDAREFMSPESTTA